MIDITKETLIRLQDVRDYLPSSRKGKKLSKAVCFRWANKGLGGVRLEVVRCSGTFTSVQALQRFIDAQAKTRTTSLDGTEHQFMHNARAAGRELEKMGI